MDALVGQAAEGDRTSFAELVRLTHSDTYTLALRLTGDPDDARDVTQEAYLRAFRAIRRFRGDARFTTWMYRITANCASSFRGRRQRDTHSPLSDDDGVVDLRPEADPVAQATRGDLRRHVAEAIAGLPPKLRSVVVLRDVYDLPHDAIASELGITVSAAKVRLHRARLKLRATLFPLPDEEADADELGSLDDEAEVETEAGTDGPAGRAGVEAS
jgi:RNA polymerase sigma-70 factor (ECF subfamily)